ncbi:hypothetical protein [Yinghuangia sp. YIM S09857]|uniref:hypothetical protein n=1 Tax=Yinghuangia sp. YIM S09857 TaxID=3436929 RepID=UPI003F53A308
MLSLADCEYFGSGGSLVVSLERSGGSDKFSGSHKANSGFEVRRESASSQPGCASPPRSPGLGKNSFECRFPGRFEITVRKGADLLELAVTEKLAENPASTDVLRGYARQVLDGL